MDFALVRASRLRQYASGLAWGPLVEFSRNKIISTLHQIRYGRLTIKDTGGGETICGEQSVAEGAVQTSLEVHSDTFWVRMLLFADMVGSPRVALAY